MITKTFILGHAVTVEFDAEIIEPPYEGGLMEFDVQGIALVGEGNKTYTPCPSRLAKIKAEIQASDTVYAELCEAWYISSSYMH